MNKRQAKKQRQKVYSSPMYILGTIITAMCDVEDGQAIAVFSNPETYKELGIKRKFHELTNSEDFTIDYKVSEYKLMDGNIIYLYSSEQLTNCGIQVCRIGNPPHKKYDPAGSITFNGGNFNE